MVMAKEPNRLRIFLVVMTISNKTIGKTSLLALISYFIYSSRLAPNIRFNHVFVFLIVLNKGANTIVIVIVFGP